MTSPRSAVIVEDNAMMREYLTMVCGQCDVTVLGAADNAEEAEAVLRAQRPDFVLMDVRLVGERTGIDVALAVHDEMPAMKTIFVTGSNEPSMRAAIEADHPHRILIKPVNPDDLREAFGLA